MDKEYYGLIKEMWASLLEPYNVDENTYSSTREASEKKLKGKLFSRKNLFVDEYDSYLNTQFNGLWSDYIKSVIDDCEYL